MKKESHIRLENLRTCLRQEKEKKKKKKKTKCKNYKGKIRPDLELSSDARMM